MKSTKIGDRRSRGASPFKRLLAFFLPLEFSMPEEDPESVLEDPESVLEDAIADMRQKLSEAREKVNAALAIEKEFQDTYDRAIAQAERWHEQANISLEAGREDLAREDLEKRNEYRRLAEHHKKQWDSQKQVVRALSDLLDHFQQKILEAEGKKNVVRAQQRNIEAEAHLRGMLNEIETSDAFETVVEMEQGSSDAAMLSKAAAEVDTVYQEIQLEREFAGYAKDASLDSDIAALKAERNKKKKRERWSRHRLYTSDDD